MKKLLLSILATVGIAIILPVSAFATGGLPTTINGTVTNKDNGNPLEGVDISVVCNGFTLTTGTVSGGWYVVQFPNGECPALQTATVTATDGSNSASKSEQVVGPSSNKDTQINLAVVNVSVVPELGTITGVGAAVLGGAAFMVVRRKQLNQN